MYNYTIMFRKYHSLVYHFLRENRDRFVYIYTIYIYNTYILYIYIYFIDTFNLRRKEGEKFRFSRGIKKKKGIQVKSGDRNRKKWCLREKRVNVLPFLRYMMDGFSRSSIRVIRTRKRIRMESLSGCRFLRRLTKRIDRFAHFWEGKISGPPSGPTCWPHGQPVAGTDWEGPSGTIPRRCKCRFRFCYALQRGGRDFCTGRPWTGLDFTATAPRGEARFAANNWIIVSALSFPFQMPPEDRPISIIDNN